MVPSSSKIGQIKSQNQTNTFSLKTSISLKSAKNTQNSVPTLKSLPSPPSEVPKNTSYSLEFSGQNCNLITVTQNLCKAKSNVDPVCHQQIANALRVNITENSYFGQQVCCLKEHIITFFLSMIRMVGSTVTICGLCKTQKNVINFFRQITASQKFKTNLDRHWKICHLNC